MPRGKKKQEEDKEVAKREPSLMEQIREGFDPLVKVKGIGELGQLVGKTGQTIGSIGYHLGRAFDADVPFMERLESGMKAGAGALMAAVTAFEQVRVLSEKDKALKRRKPKAETE